MVPVSRSHARRIFIGLVFAAALAAAPAFADATDPGYVPTLPDIPLSPPPAPIASTPVTPPAAVPTSVPAAVPAVAAPVVPPAVALPPDECAAYAPDPTAHAICADRLDKIKRMRDASSGRDADLNAYYTQLQQRAAQGQQPAAAAPAQGQVPAVAGQAPAATGQPLPAATTANGVTAPAVPPALPTK